MAASSKMGCSLVVPCYNEENRLNQPAFLEFLQTQSDCKLILVNDGSHDQTLAALQSLKDAAGSGRIDILDLDQNRGKAEAVRQGMLLALDQGSPLVGYWDADLATPFEEYSRLLQPLLVDSRVQMAMGARVKLLGRSIDRKLLRHYLGRCFATAASTLLQLAVYDTQCGAKLFRSSLELKQAIQKPFLTGWVFDVELISRLLQLRQDFGQKMVEVPLQTWKDVAGSKVRPLDFFIAFFELLKIFRERKKYAAKTV